MPIDFGVPDMLMDEYNRFVTGLLDLADGGQLRAREAAARVAPGAPDKAVLAIPGWDDVIHVVPQPRVGPEQRAAHYAALRAGLPSPLEPGLVEQLERQTRRARLINASASPAWARAYGQVMTALDNVQDFTTTLVVAGRLTLNPAVRVLDQLGYALAPTATREAALAAARTGFVASEAAYAGLGAAERLAIDRLVRDAAQGALARTAWGLGTRTIGRLIPILGAVLLIGDLLKLLTQLGMLLFPAYALWCRGLPALASAAVPAALLGPSLKLAVSGLANQNPFAHRHRLKRSRIVRRLRPSFANLIEVAQTTDQLFGVGISFGALVGLVGDAAFAGEQLLRGRDVEVTAQPFTDSVHRLFERRLGQVPTPALHDLRTASNVLAHGHLYNGTQETFTIEEHAEALVAQSAAWSFLRPWIEAPEMDAALELVLDAEVAPPAYGEREVLAALAAAGEVVPPGRVWTLAGNPERIRGELLAEQTAGEVAAALAELVLAHRDEPFGVFVGAVARRILDRAALLMTGSADAIEFELLPHWQVLESLALANEWIVGSSDEALVGEFFARCARYLESTGRRQLGADVVRRIAADVGLELTHLVPIDSPWSGAASVVRA